MRKKQVRNTTDSNGDIFVKTVFFGVGITNEKKSNILEFVLNSLEKSDRKYFIVTPNPEMIVYAAHHPEFKHILNSAQIALCDGVGLFVASKFLGKQLQKRITGVDFMEMLCESISEKPITVGFLGGRNGVAALAVKRLQEKYPGLKVAFIGEEADEMTNYQVSNSNEIHRNHTVQSNTESRLDQNKFKSIDILFVAFGFPKQEEWIFKNLGNYNIRVMMGVGGAFDYFSGQVPRPPKWIQSIGFEWLYRLIRQPWRWKRQLALIEFIYLVFKEKLH